MEGGTMADISMWMTTEEVARFHGVVPETVRMWVRSGRLRLLRRVGVTLVFDRAVVEVFKPPRGEYHAFIRSRSAEYRALKTNQ